MKKYREYLEGYVEQMKEQMQMFHTINTDLLGKYEGRQVKVIDKMGYRLCGLFKGFKVCMDMNGEKPVPELFIQIQLIKKDGTPSNRFRIMNCEKALIRVMGVKPLR